MASKSLVLFNELIEQIKHSSPEQRVKIHEQLQAASQKMNEKFESVCEQFGVTRAEMESMMNDPANFNSDSWESIQDLKKEVDKGRNDLVKTFDPEYKERKERKSSSPKKWLNA